MALLASSICELDSPAILLPLAVRQPRQRAFSNGDKPAGDLSF